ncbi:MAG: hypothetical protein A2X48_08580 [Lentisphaerae bacterium GWF2_49_21]|nr:MAG: hypothetical protein A2X48_08580 [Lentisphaerae bacterium GWF2_49_21]
MYKLILNPFLLALSLLTRLPVRVSEADSSDWGRSAAYFPFCGYILAFLAAMPFMLICCFSDVFSFFTSNPFAALAVILIGDFLFVAGLAWMTGILHIDGFCDSCDAFSSMSATKEDRLKIMKDPHPGAAAVAYLILLIIGKLILLFLVIFSVEKHVSFLLYNKYQDNYVEHLMLFKVCLAIVPLAFLSATTVIARFAMVLLAAISKYPRESGTGAVIVGKVPVLSIFIAALWLLPFVLLIPWRNLILALILAGMVMLYWKFRADRLLGGVTGDILGACCETAELAVALGIILPEFIKIG